MKIALVCPYDIAYPGGVTNHVTRFAEHARKLGHVVTVIAPSSRKISKEGFVRAGKAIPLPIKGGTVSRLAFSFWNFPKVKKLFNRGQYDVIHIHEPGAPLLGLFALAYAPQGKSAIVTTSHTNTPHNFFMDAYISITKSIWLAKHLMRKVDLKIAVSEAARGFISKYFPGEYLIMPNGVDTARFKPTATPIGQYADGKVNILFVGRLGNNEKRKGLKYLILAFNKLQSRHPNTRLIVVGPGKPDGDTKRIIKAHGNREIIFAGKVSPEELPRYYATADIFCSPATHGESFGMVLIEAMASGKPVVASNIDGYKEVILEQSRKTEIATPAILQAGPGILVRPKNVYALAIALEMLTTDEKLRKKMGAKGRKLVLERFSWERVSVMILDAYKRATAAKKQRKESVQKVRTK